MSDLLPDQPLFRINQTTGAVRRSALSDLDHLIVVLPHKPSATTWKSVPDGGFLRRQLQKLASGDDIRVLNSRLGNRAGTGVSVATMPKAAGSGAGAFPVLKFAGEVATAALANRPRSLAIMTAGLDAETSGTVIRSLILAAGAAGFRLPEYRRKPSPASRLRQLRLLGLAKKMDLARTMAEIEAANLVRWLTALPPNMLTATGYRELIAQLSEHYDWSMRVLDLAALKRLGAGAFLAVARGSASADAAIVHLSWRPRARRRADVALVGKGIVFDTGGTNLKPFRSMLDMHHDMCGSAVALGVLLAVTRLKLPLAVDCWLAISENRLGPQAYKSRDVVTAANGTTIEVIHTDAEGRMALADTLVFAGRENARLIIDYATLTGQCVNALTERYSGVFTNRPALNELLIAAGRDCGERVWPFPMDEDFDEELKSEVADVLQCSPDNEGDHILAARFLQRFVPATQPWIHIDLSSATRKKGLGHVPGGPTGSGVRLTLNLLVEHARRLDGLLGAGSRKRRPAG